MKALWLTSWYPNEINKTNGDFVQRHAQATSLYCKVDVVHVEKDICSLLKTPIQVTKNTNGNLSETIILFKSNTLFFAGRLISLIKYKDIFKKQLKKYIKENGLPDIVHVQIAMKAGTLALWLKEKYNIPYVITEQWTMYNSKAKDAYENRNIIFKNFTKKIFENASLFLTVSKNLAETIEKKIVKVSFKVAYNVVNTKYFFYKEDDEKHKFVFVHVSTMREQKNPEAIIDAFILFHKQYPNSKLLMIGDVPQEINEYYSKKNLPENIIEFTGFMPYEKIGAVIQRCNAFMLFSKRENMPCVVLEALCCGLPVITSNAGGTAEVINKNNGVVISDYTKEALLQAMINLYISYETYNRKEIASKAAVKFSYNTIGKEITDAYASVIKDNKRSSGIY
jgi:glycosyltransferase involved in cell wall biosynthesis